MKKKFLVFLGIMSTTPILVGCVNKKPVIDLTNAPKFVTHEIQDFTKGKSNYFQVSNGWTNGSPFDVTWNSSNITTDETNGLGIAITGEKGSLKSGETRSIEKFQYGFYGISVKPMKVEGTATAFFTYTGESFNDPHDEIDIEFLGKDTTKVQFNYFTNGKGGNEYMYDLGFDASEDYHDYGFYWDKTQIIWYVDNVPVYRVTESIPTTSQYIFLNSWSGDDTAKGWMGTFAGSSDKTISYYKSVSYASVDGKPYVPSVDPTPDQPDIPAGEATWTDTPLEFLPIDEYQVENNTEKNSAHVTYQGVKNEYHNIRAELPDAGETSNAYKMKVKNNGTKEVTLRVDLVDNTSGKDVVLNQTATQDGNPVTTDLEWGGSFFQLAPGKESEVQVNYKGKAQQLVLFFDSTIAGQEGPWSGDVTISEYKLGVYKEADLEEKDTDLTFNSTEEFTVGKKDGVTSVSYSNVAGNSYKNISAAFPESSSYQALSFSFKNTGTMTIKARVDIIDSAGKPINTQATMDDVTIRTDLEYGGSYFDVEANKTVTIKVFFKWAAQTVLLFLDSAQYDDTSTHSGSAEISSFKAYKANESNPSGFENMTFTTNETAYKVTNDGTSNTIVYTDVKDTSYSVVTSGVSITGKTKLSFKVKNNNADSKVNFRIDLISEESQNNEKNKSINKSATFDGKEAQTDMEWGGSFVTLEPNQEGIMVVTFEGDPILMNIFIDSFGGTGDGSLHSGSVTFSEFAFN